MTGRWKALLITMGVILSALTGCAGGKNDKTNTVTEMIETENSCVLTEQPSQSVIEAKRSDETQTANGTKKTEETAADEIEANVPMDEDLVLVKDYIPGIVVELKYATEDNFTGTVIYDFSDAVLRYGTVKKLAEAEKAFEAMGLRIKIWDAYRPVEAQERLWEVYPDPVYVADPSNGITSHSRGDTIDCTLVYMDGSEVEMPTGFDDFSTMADRYYDDCSEEAAANVRMMEEIMYAHGFTGYEGEWWDFSDTDQYW